MRTWLHLQRFIVSLVGLGAIFCLAPFGYLAEAAIRVCQSIDGKLGRLP